MDNDITSGPDRQSFENLRQANQHGAEYWNARDLQPLLGYSQWRRFEEAIRRAITYCEQSGNDSTYHFAGAGKMVALGSGSEREIPDFHLSRFACNLIAQHGDPRKHAIAEAQKYFAIQTRRQELSDAYAADIQRGELREQARVRLQNIRSADPHVASRLWSICATGLMVVVLAFVTSNTPAAVLVPESAECYVFRGVVVDGETGEPAPDVEFVWQDRNGERYEVWLDDEGCFQALMGMPLGWWSAAYARQGERVSQLMPLRRYNEREAVLVLGEPAGLHGTVTDPEGHAVVGAIVGIASSYTNGGGLFYGVTDSEGRYQIEGAAPGTYDIEIAHSHYYASGLSKWPDGVVELTAGVASKFDFTVKRKAHIEGQVLGPDQKPAGRVSISQGPDAKPIGVTDDGGRFSTWVIPRGDRTKIQFQRADMGRATLEIIPKSTVTLRLSGVTRLTGRVTGPNGEPVAEAYLRDQWSPPRYHSETSGILTDSEGRFDIGWISLGDEAAAPLELVVGKDWNWEELTRAFTMAPPTAPAFYYSKNVEVPASHGEERSLEVQLEPIPWRTLSGTALNEKGAPLENVIVAVYVGDANADHWLDDVCNRMPTEPERYPWRPRSSMSPPPETAKLIARTRTNLHGQWQVRILAQSPLLLSRDEVAVPARLTVAAATGDFSLATVARYSLADPNLMNIEARLTLQPLDTRLFSHISVVDGAARPMAEFPCIVNGFGPFKTDGEGVLRVPRFGDGIEVTLVPENATIISADFEGRQVFPPSPDSDVPQEGIPVRRIGREDEVVFFRSSVYVPSLNWNGNKLQFDYFDPSQGSLRVVIDPANS